MLIWRRAQWRQLTLVLPGAVTDGVVLYFFRKKVTNLFGHRHHSQPLRFPVPVNRLSSILCKFSRNFLDFH